MSWIHHPSIRPFHASPSSGSSVGIDAYRDAKLAEIEREREIEVQIQETERTEERSQFWQKIVPWGDDEEEENK